MASNATAPMVPAAFVLPALDSTMGAFYIGVVVSAVLYGVTCLQTYHYFNNYHGDPIYMKLLVGVVWGLDTVHQALISHAVYIYLIKNFANPAILTTVVWSVVVEVIINGIMAFLVQGFFVYRIFKLSNRNIWLSAPVAGMSIAEFAVIMTYSAKAVPITQFTESLKLGNLSLTVNAMTAVTDVAIAVVLCYLLQKSRTGFRRSDTLITKLIIFTVNTGLLTSIDAIGSLISYAASRDTFIYICFFFALGRLYSNSLLATLNVRHALAGKVQDSRGFESTSISLQGIHAARSGVSANMMSHPSRGPNLAIKIDTTKEYAPHDVDAGELTVVSQKSIGHDF